jgi:formate hydrogenlyase subunit 3/multisubunit Na+/H+ antiporter MnhD subunit
MQFIWIWLASAVLIGLLQRRYPREASWAGAAVAGIAIVLGLRFLFLEEAVGRIELGEIWIQEIIINLSLRLDSLAEALIVVVAVISLSALLASIARKEYQTTPLILLAAGATSAGILAGDLATLYISSLLLSIVVSFAIAWRGMGRIAVQAFATAEVAASGFLAACIFVAALTGSMQINTIRNSAALSSLVGEDWIFLPLIAGVLLRCGVAPFHTWITGASEKLSPSNAAWVLVLPPVLGLYTLCRNWTWIFRLDPGLMLDILGLVGAVTVVVASYASLHAGTVKQVAAWTSVSLIGYVPLSLALFYDISILAAVAFLVSFSLLSPLLYLMAGRLADFSRQERPQEQVSIWLALFPMAAVIGLPVAFVFEARYLLAQALMDRPFSQAIPFVAFVAASAFSTLAMMGLIARLRRVSASGLFVLDSQKALSDPYNAAIAAPAVLLLAMGALPSIASDLLGGISGVASNPLAGFYITSPAGVARSAILVFAGPALGLWLYDLNQDSPSWRWKVLGVQQLEGRAEEPWWTTLRQLDLYYGLRNSLFAIARGVATVVDAVSSVLCR